MISEDLLTKTVENIKPSVAILEKLPPARRFISYIEIFTEMTARIDMFKLYFPPEMRQFVPSVEEFSKTVLLAAGANADDINAVMKILYPKGEPNTM